MLKVSTHSLLIILVSETYLFLISKILAFNDSEFGRFIVFLLRVEVPVEKHIISLSLSGFSSRLYPCA